jgi:hypothetical protein
MTDITKSGPRDINIPPGHEKMNSQLESIPLPAPTVKANYYVRVALPDLWDEAAVRSLLSADRGDDAGCAPTQKAEYLDIVFEFASPPDQKGGRFVEVEDSSGRSVDAGEWIHRDDGYWVLRIPRTSIDDNSRNEEVTAAETATAESILSNSLYSRGISDG